MESVRQVTDLDSLRTQISELEQRSGAPDLWDDPDTAQEVTSRLSRANSELERITSMDDRIDELEVLVQLGVEESDAATRRGAAEALKRRGGTLRPTLTPPPGYPCTRVFAGA